MKSRVKGHYRSAPGKNINEIKGWVYWIRRKREQGHNVSYNRFEVLKDRKKNL